MTLILHPLYLAVIAFIFNALPQLIIISKKPLSLVSANSDHPLRLLNFTNVTTIQGTCFLEKCLHH